MITQDRIDAMETELPSVRIRESLKALDVFSKTEDCKVDMASFHEIKDEECFACLGGASALVRFEIDRDMWQSITDQDDLCELVGDPNEDLVEDYEDSLDRAMSGDIDNMFDLMGLNHTLGYEFMRPMTPYHKDPAKWRAEMEVLVNDLAKAGY